MIPCKITLRGDKDYARNYIGAAQSQMRILKNQMSFQNLKQGARRVQLNPRTIIEARVCFDLSEVIIHCLPIIRKPLIPEKELLKDVRFFAEVLRGWDEVGLPIFTYHWFRVIEGSEGNIEIITRESLSETINITLKKVLTLPENSLSAFTKAFMLHNKSKEIDERWVAHQHMLSKDKVIKYDFSRPGAYPIDIYCELHDLCPQNRFYCNTEKGSMIWYTANQHVFCGIIANVKNGEVEARHPSVDHYSFTTVPVIPPAEPYWSLHNDSYLTDVPYDLIPDVNSLTFDSETGNVKLEVVLLNGMRPVLVTLLFGDGTDHCHPIDTCGHWKWVEEGFKKIPLASLTQDLEDDIAATHKEDECTLFPTFENCSQWNGDYLGCVDHNGHCKQVGWRRSQWYEQECKKESDYKVNFFEAIADIKTMKRDWRIFDDQKKGYFKRCEWVGSSTCRLGISTDDCGAVREIKEDGKSKVAKSFSATWMGPNVGYKEKNINRNYCIFSATQHSRGDHGGLDAASFAPGYWSTPIKYCVDQTPAFYGTEMPGDDWPGTIIDTFWGDHLEGWTWKRVSDESTYTEPTVNFFGIDTGDTEGEYPNLVFNASIISKVYYLDDRSTKDTQGLIVAGNGVVGDIHYWGIYHNSSNKEDQHYHVDVDISEKLFDALNCVEEGITTGIITGLGLI